MDTKSYLHSRIRGRLVNRLVPSPSLRIAKAGLNTDRTIFLDRRLGEERDLSNTAVPKIDRC